MIRITDELIENNDPVTRWGEHLASAIQNEFRIDDKILQQEKDMHEYFLTVCKSYVVHAYCQSRPFNTKDIFKEEWYAYIKDMWTVSQRDNEYNPTHFHFHCDLSAVMYLKIPEYLPNRKSHRNDDGKIVFTNNTSQEKLWSYPTMDISPNVGDIFIFPASQQHMVYPFRTSDGKGERRSVSFNANFSSKTEQDRLTNKMASGEIYPYEEAQVNEFNNIPIPPHEKANIASKLRYQDVDRTMFHDDLRKTKSQLPKVSIVK